MEVETEDLKSLEFLAINSKEIIEKQVDSYRQQHSYAGTIIGVTVLFIPFFLNGLDGTSQITEYLSAVPILLFICAILLMLTIFRSKPLDQAFSPVKYQQFLTKPYKEILLNEITANTRSYTKNITSTEKGTRLYTTGVSLTTIALLLSITLLLVNQFIRIEKAPTRVQVVNTNMLPATAPKN